MTIRVLVVDGYAIVRAGLRAILGTQSDIEVVGEATDGPSAVRLISESEPHLVVFDPSLTGLSCAELIAHLRKEYPNCRAIALATSEDGESVRRAFAEGVAGYVLKRSDEEELIRAIRTVASGTTFLNSAVAAYTTQVRTEESTELSERECEVVRLIASGYSNKEIAARLKVSVKTVETYKTRSMEKLQIRSRVDIVRYAVRRGWLTNLDEPCQVHIGARATHES